MKKLLLLLTLAITFSASAQQHHNRHRTAVNPQQMPLQRKLEAGAGNKATDGSIGAWYSFQEANYIYFTSKSWLYPLMPDSTFWVADSVQPYFYNIMGMGYSFDPASTRLDSCRANLLYPPADFTITNAVPFTLDSILVAGRYDRLHNYTDTLFIDITIADTTAQTFKLNFGPHAFYMDSISDPDGRLQCAFAGYDWTTNRISSSVTKIRRITKILDAAAAADTIDGMNWWTFALVPPLPAAAGGKVVVQTTFASGYAYPFQTDIDSANKWNAFTLELNGPGTAPIHKGPCTDSVDYNCGLVIETSERYHLADYSNHLGTAIQAATYDSFYFSPIGFEDPYFAFFIKCPDCPTSIAEVKNALIELNAYPNPANDEINIIFSSAGGGKASITVTSIIGQVMDSKHVSTRAKEKTKTSFSTANLSGGIYFYTVEANGQRETGRFVVRH